MERRESIFSKGLGFLEKAGSKIGDSLMEAGDAVVSVKDKIIREDTEEEKAAKAEAKRIKKENKERMK